MLLVPKTTLNFELIRIKSDEKSTNQRTRFYRRMKWQMIPRTISNRTVLKLGGSSIKYLSRKAMLYLYQRSTLIIPVIPGFPEKNTTAVAKGLAASTPWQKTPQISGIEPHKYPFHPLFSVSRHSPYSSE